MHYWHVSVIPFETWRECNVFLTRTLTPPSCHAQTHCRSASDVVLLINDRDEEVEEEEGTPVRI
jgi:hypothetical protein